MVAEAVKYGPSADFVGEVARQLDHLPLGSVSDIANCFGGSERWVRSALEYLGSRGDAYSAELSMGRGRGRRWWLAEGYTPGRRRHDGRVMCRLAENPTAAAWFYYMTSLFLSDRAGRRLQEFSWLFSRSFEAACRFNDGWVALTWSGLWDGRERLRARFAGLSESLKAGESEAGSFPSKLCFVTPDFWQGWLVMDVAREFGMEDLVCASVVDARLFLGSLEFRGGRGWMLPPLGRNGVDGRFRADAMDGFPVRDPDGMHLLRVGMMVEQWPGIRARMVSIYCHIAGAVARSMLRKLEGMGLVDCRHGKYSVTRRWLAAAARRDRVWSGRPVRHFDAERVAEYFDGRIGRHEQGVMRVVGAFAQDGCWIAPGWRCNDLMGKNGSIVPDALVWIEQGPFGAGWHYLEYEMRSMSMAHVRAKLKGYRLDIRADRYPLLMVCQPGIAPKFQEEGRDLEMLTASVREVASGPVAGSEGTVWNCRGDAVRVLTGRAD